MQLHINFTKVAREEATYLADMALPTRERGLRFDYIIQIPERDESSPAYWVDIPSSR
jgi:hypothetical protein